MHDRLLIVLTRLVGGLRSPENEFIEVWNRTPDERWWAPESHAGRQLLVMHCHDYPLTDKEAAKKAARDFSAVVEGSGVGMVSTDKEVGVAVHTGSESVRKAVARSASSLRPIFVTTYTNGQALFGELATMVCENRPYRTSFDEVWQTLDSPRLAFYNSLGALRHSLTKAVGPLIQDLKTWTSGSFGTDLAREIVADQRQFLREIERTVFELVHRDNESVLSVITAVADRFPACGRRLMDIAGRLQQDVRYEKASPLPRDVTRLIQALCDADTLLEWRDRSPAEVASHVEAMLSWWSRIQKHLDEACTVIVSVPDPHRQPHSEVG